MSTFKTDSRLHLALNVSDFDKSLDFYKALLNMEATKLKPGYAKFEVESPPLNLTLNQAKKVSGNQINHLGIQVKAGKNVKEQQARLEKLGLATKVEENTTCCYALQDKVWVQDPDGNAWETFVVYEDSEYMRLPTEEKSSCCVKEEKQTASCC